MPTTPICSTARSSSKAAEGEKLTTLDDVVRPLHPDDLLITDASGPIGLAGVMGGATAELSLSTRNVVIEAAHFDAMTIARPRDATSCHRRRPGGSSGR